VSLLLGGRGGGGGCAWAEFAVRVDGEPRCDDD